MKNEKNNYLVEVSYSVTDITKKKSQSKIIRNKKKSFITPDLETIESSFKNLQPTLDYQKGTKNVLDKW